MRASTMVLNPLLLIAACTVGAATAAPEDGVISGRILSASNVEVGDVDVTIEPPVGEMAVGSDGRYSIRNLAAGEYVVTFAAAGYETQTHAIPLAAGVSLVHDVWLIPEYRALGEVTVSSSFSLNRSDPMPGVALDRRQLLDLPHVGDDVIRALPLLPGVAAGDTSGQFNVRGGLFREVLFELDGLEIYEPYHLQDFEGVFSIIDPRLLDEVQLLPGGFTSEYGDRSAAVLDLTTIEPEGDFAGEIGISFMTFWANGQGGFADGRGSWFGSVRRGFLDLVMGLVGPEDSETEKTEGNGPAYWDVNGKLGYELAPGHRLTGRLLWSDDGVDQEEWEIEDGEEEYEFWDTGYGNASLWLHDAWVLGERTFVTTVASYNRVDRDRVAAGEDYTGTTSIRDERELEVLGVKQDWSLQASPSHYLKWGFDLRRYDATYDYANEYTHFGKPTPGRTFAGEYSATNTSFYAADRFRLGETFTAEVGARWERFGVTDESHVSPRLNLVWAVSDSTVVRTGWGRFMQSQRPHELQVMDGETEFSPAERAEHRTLGLEHWWRSGDAGWSVRAEVYQRLMEDARPRYENLFDPFQLYPETSYYRYRIAPESAEARGAEVFLSRRGPVRFDWWVNYTFSEVTDRIDGRDVPRQFDQTHALTLSGTWRPSPKWTLSGAWLYHSGWPTTKVDGVLVPAPGGGYDIEPVFGPVNDERLPDYHRLDLRFARRFELDRLGALEFFLDVQNAYARRNVSGYAVDDRAFTIGEDNQVVYSPREEKWLGILPSFGVSWSF